MTARSLLDRGADLLRGFIPAGSPLRRILRPLGRRLRGRPVWHIGDFIEHFADACPDAFFVQVGANDGVQQDPLRVGIERQRWRGILIEPLPYVFERLRAYRGNNPRLILENVAIADQAGNRDFYYLEQSDDPALPRWYDALGSFHREVLESHAARIPDIERRIRVLSVPCLTFEQLCAKHGVSRIDLIHTDVEGYDWTLIQNIDLERFKPLVLLYEHHHQDAATRAACRQHLERHGYSLLSEGLDTLAVRRQDLAPALARRFDRCRAALAGTAV